MKSKQHRSFTRMMVILFIILALSLPLMLPPAAASTAGMDVQRQLETRTKEDIMAHWLKYKQLSQDQRSIEPKEMFLEQPSLSSPYQIGKLKPQYLQEGLDAVNFFRYLAGLPDDIELDWSLETQQQTAALVLAASDEDFNQPEDMANELFKLGYDALSESNIFWWQDYPTLYQKVQSMIAGSVYGEVLDMYERNRILHPHMKKTMFGSVYLENEDSPVLPVSFTTMYGENRERSKHEVSYDYISWPSAGYFPEEAFSPFHPWTVSLNPNNYDIDHVEDISVILTRKSDRKTWLLDWNDDDPEKSFFDIEVDASDIMTIIFRPGELYDPLIDEQFDVQINGLYGKDGSKRSLSYSTTFFEILPGFRDSFWATLGKGDILTPWITQDTDRADIEYFSTDEKVVQVDQHGRVTAVGEGHATVYANSYLNNLKSLNIIVFDGTTDEYISKWAKPNYLKLQEAGLVPALVFPDKNDYYTRAGFTIMAVNVIQLVTSTVTVEEVQGLGKSPFLDTDHWEIAWAKSKGIIDGTGNGKFSPDAPVTREQAAKLLLQIYQYIQKTRGEGATNLPTDVLTFHDRNLISPWAIEYVQQAVGLKLMQGNDQNRFNPRGLLLSEPGDALFARMLDTFRNG